MKIFLDFAIVALFFIAYQFYDMYTAVMVVMIIYPLQAIGTWVVTKKWDKTLLFTATIVVLLGGATLAFHNETFFKWKPTLIYWLFAAIALGSHFIGETVIAQRLLGKNLPVAPQWWPAINISWIVFFLSMGVLNLIVVFSCSTTTWVYFKLFGLLGLTILFMLAQIAFLTWRKAIIEPSS